MEYCTGRTEFDIQENAAITLGKFDGVHAGHRKLMKRILEHKKQGCKAVVFTFDAPPYSVLRHEKPQILTTNEERRIILERLGIDFLVECPFVSEIIGMEPEDFIKRILVDRLKAKYIVIGTDFRFGHNRRGDAKMLAEYAATYGYELEIVEKEDTSVRSKIDVSLTWGQEKLNISAKNIAVHDTHGFATLVSNSPLLVMI